MEVDLAQLTLAYNEVDLLQDWLQSLFESGNEIFWRWNYTYGPFLDN